MYDERGVVCLEGQAAVVFEPCPVGVSMPTLSSELAFCVLVFLFAGAEEALSKRDIRLGLDFALLWCLKLF